jgi:preprotein translocase subunit SecE
MARDRKRAKQRRRKRTPGQAPEGARRAEQAPLDADELEAAKAAREERPEEDDPNAAPDPLRHASAEMDEAEEATHGHAPVGKLTEEEQNLTREDKGGTGTEDIEGHGVPPTRRGGNRVFAFLRASWAELRRVQWPDRRHTAQATAVVLGFVVVAGAYLGAADFVFSRLMDWVLGL